MEISIFESDGDLNVLRAERVGLATVPEPSPDCRVRLVIAGEPDAVRLREVVLRWLDSLAVGR